MHETPEDLDRLQALLDSSYASAGEHLLSIHEPSRRASALVLSGQLAGVRVLDVATVTARGEPIVSPVDGLFYRGRFWFGSSHDSVRFRHIRARPAVSAAHTVGEMLGVVVHGIAREVDMGARENLGYLQYLKETYGDGWFDWGRGAAYAVIEARKMFAFWHPPDDETNVAAGRPG